MSNANCGLCGYTTCTLFHILCNCTFSLLNKRYNWRHDTVLSTFEPFIRERLRKQNELKEIKRELKQTGSLLLFEFCKKLGFLKRAIRDISKTLSKVALRCSYLIYLSRNNQNWKPLTCVLYR